MIYYRWLQNINDLLWQPARISQLGIYQCLVTYSKVAVGRICILWIFMDYIRNGCLISPIIEEFYISSLIYTKCIIVVCISKHWYTKRITFIRLFIRKYRVINM